MEQRSYRCPSCPTHVRADETVRKFHTIRSWASFDELAQSAENGCDFCILMRQWLAHCHSIDKIRDAVDIKLTADRTSWALGSSSLRGTVWFKVLTSEELEQMARSTPMREESRMFGQAAEWLHECLEEHGDCRPRGSGRRSRQDYPKRLIDISQPDTLEVFNCKDRIREGSMRPSNLKYCTLSYCWGDAAHSCILTQPFENTLVIDLKDVPQTFLDAVTVAKRLGFRYLWIDALCIVQPSAEDDRDWLEEGSRMGVVYQNAACNIAATAARHANQGFLKQTGSSHFMAEPVKMCKAENGVETDVYIPNMVPRFYESISNSVLNTRGWVVQERALSTRTLHFSVHGLFWECGSSKAHNVYGTLQNRDDFPSCRSKENLLRVARTQRTRHVCPVEWFHFVKRYSWTNFTNPQDRLLALTSVAKAVQPYLGGHEYVAGLWKNDILRGIAWKCRVPWFRGTDPLTPSWSWAAAKGGIDFGVFSLRMYRYDLVKVLDVSVTPVLASNPFGRVKDGSLTLLGKLMSMWLPKEQKGFDADLIIDWDDPPDRDCPNPDAKFHLKRYDLLPIGRERTPMLNRTHLGALILEPTGRADTVETEEGVVRLRSEFRRIGWVELAYRREEKGHWWEEREAEEIILI